MHADQFIRKIASNNQSLSIADIMQFVCVPIGSNWLLGKNKSWEE